MFVMDIAKLCIFSHLEHLRVIFGNTELGTSKIGG